MSSNIDDKLNKFESNSDLSEQNIQFFEKNEKLGINFKKNTNNKQKNEKDSIFSESSNENNENEINQNENNNYNLFDKNTVYKNVIEKKQNTSHSKDIIDINDSNDNLDDNNNDNYQNNNFFNMNQSNNYQYNNNNYNYLRQTSRNSQNQNLGNKFQNLKYNSRRSSNNLNNNNKFVMKNGCCRDCMKAFSKNGKSCLCQVPKRERKFHLSENGCSYCGCKGCNPIDVKYNERKAQKYILFQDKNIFYKNQRILDSEDEDLKIKDEVVDSYNIEKREIKEDLNENLKINSIFFGYGVPLRTPSYILGYNPVYN